MTINDIFQRVSLGPEQHKFEKTQKMIFESYDSDMDLFFVSQYISDLNKGMMWEENNRVARNLEKIKVKLESVETRLSDGKILTEAYKRVSSSGITEDYRTIIESMNSRNEFAKVSDKDRLAKMLAAAKYATHKYVNNNAIFAVSTNPILEHSIKEEEKVIGEVI